MEGYYPLEDYIKKEELEETEATEPVIEEAGAEAIEPEADEIVTETAEAEGTDTEDAEATQEETEEAETEDGAEETGSDETEIVPADAPVKKKSKAIPIIIAVLVILLGAAGFAYVNNLLKAPKEIVNEDGSYYCLDGKGNKIVSQWIDFEESRYYATEDGKLYANTIEKIDGGSYCFAEDAKLLSGIFKFQEGIYSSEPDGKLIEVKGWEEHDGNTYYNSGTGQLVSSGILDVDGENYYMNEEGILQKDTIFDFNEAKYCADSDGKILKSQPIERDGKKYYAGADGAFVKNGFTPHEDYYFYINENSEVSKEPVELENGYTITPDPETGAISAKEYKISQSEYIYNGQATYIKVVIDGQYMEYVKDGELLVSSYVVTGMYDQYDTPRGTYEILYKARNVQLKGEIVLDGQYEEVPLTEEEKTKIWDAMSEEEKKDPNAKSKIPATKKVQKKEKWDVTVNYWLSFIGGTYGFHDATWRSYFGDYIYTYDGSHGCVNLPLWAAEELYNNVEDGTPVYII